MNKILIGFISLIIMIGLSGCVNASNPEPIISTELTVGVVQKEIKKGMTQSEVASALGSPNIVSSAGENKETWIYDKISSQVSYGKSGGYVALILIGGSSESENMTASQKTLTIIIHFEKGQVHDFKYHSTRF